MQPRARTAFFAALAGAAGIQLGARLLARSRRMDGQVVFVTGGSRGLGLAIALECAKRGAALAIAARDREELARATVQLRAGRTTVLPIVCDVRDKDAVRHAIERTQSIFRRIDMLVNNAGIISVGPMETMTEGDYRDAMDTHFWATYYAVEAVRPHFTARRRGRIVNVTSIGGKIAVPHLLPYSASKFAATGYSEGLRAELSRYGVSVTTVCPGLMRTGSPRNAGFKSQNRKEYAWFMLSDSLPGISIAASSAAREVVQAALANRAEVILSKPAQTAALVHGVAPGFVSNAMALAARLLPQPGGGYSAARRGSQSESWITQSPLTALSRRSERQYNER